MLQIQINILYRRIRRKNKYLSFDDTHNEKEIYKHNIQSTKFVQNMAAVKCTRFIDLFFACRGLSMCICN